MGTLVAGIKEIFSPAKTTGTNVMLSGNDGTPDGHITMSNLASVLGGIMNSGSLADTDLNTLNIVAGGYIVRSSCTNLPSQVSSYLANYLIVIPVGLKNAIQILSSYNVDALFIRYCYWSGIEGTDSVWNPWHRIY